jgi:hypothetical protein
MASPIPIMAEADVQYAVEMLIMSKAAVALSLAMLGCLLICMAFVHIAYAQKLNVLPRGL